MTIAESELKPINTPQQVAEYLGVTVASLSQARYLGTGIPFIKVGRLIRYKAEAVATYLEANTYHRTDERLSA